MTSKPATNNEKEKINWPASMAFFGVHLMCLFVFMTGASWVAVITMIVAYGTRMFGITGGYHRYFSHRTYKTSRLFQFLLAFLGGTATQKGALWWAAHHRMHHKYSDTEMDIHSPRQRGFWWSHVTWILCDKYNETDMKVVHDLAKYPELVFLNKYHLIPPVIFATGMFFFGSFLESYYPELGTNGFQMLVWGYFVSTTLLYHGTFTVNSLTHVFGKKRFETGDDSRNSFLIAVITLGEGWHNNHHRYPASERQGFYWWELDLAHYTIKLFSFLGLVSDIRKPPLEKLTAEANEYKARLSRGIESAVQTTEQLVKNADELVEKVSANVKQELSALEKAATESKEQIARKSDEIVDSIVENVVPKKATT